jgi:hypothetical protein
LDSNVELERLAQPEKQDFEMVPIDEGIQIDRSDEQGESVDSPRPES